MNSNLPWEEQWRLKALEYSEANAAATLLEDTKGAVFSQMVTRQIGVSVAKAEHLVKSSPEWTDHVKAIIAARTRADELRIERDFLKMKYERWQSENADRRTEIRITGMS